MENNSTKKNTFLGKRNSNNENRLEVVQDSAIDNSDVSNRKRSKYEGKYVDQNKRNSSVVWDIDLWLTLGDCKRIYKLRIQEYLNDVLRKALEEDYPKILEHNSSRGIEW